MTAARMLLGGSNLIPPSWAVSVLPASAFSPPNKIVHSNVVTVDFKRKTIVVNNDRRGIQVDQELPDWQKAVVGRLSRLRGLTSGWDGPLSLPISDAAITLASRLIDVVFKDIDHPAPPSAVPFADGSLQLEWRLVDLRAEFAIASDLTVSFWALDRTNAHEVEAEDQAAKELFLKWAHRMTADKLIAQ